MDASVKFYKEVLGLEEIPINGLPDYIRWFRLGDKDMATVAEMSGIEL